MKPVLLFPVLGIAAIGWVAFCLYDLVRARQVRYLSKWGWAIIICGIGLTVPFGGIVYLCFGKVHPPRTGEPHAVA